MKATIERKLKNGITVAELIEQLQASDPDAKVLFVCDYGDYHHTQQALPVSEVRGIEYGENVVESAYSQSGLALYQEDAQDMDGEEKEGSEQFVILS